jgi:hypothetical protein
MQAVERGRVHPSSPFIAVGPVVVETELNPPEVLRVGQLSRSAICLSSFEGIRDATKIHDDLLSKRLKQSRGCCAQHSESNGEGLHGLLHLFFFQGKVEFLARLLQLQNVL